MNFTGARDDGVAVDSAGPHANHLHRIPDNHASTSSLSFYRLDALPAGQPTASKYRRQEKQTLTTAKIVQALSDRITDHVYGCREGMEMVQVTPIRKF